MYANGLWRQTVSVQANDHHHGNEDEDQKHRKPRQFSILTILLFIFAGGLTVPTIAWPIGDMVYLHQLVIPKPWLSLCAVAWLAVLVQIGREEKKRDNRVIIRNQESINDYLEHLANGIDNYGDTREREGHRLAEVIRSNGNGRSLHVVD